MREWVRFNSTNQRKETVLIKSIDLTVSPSFSIGGIRLQVNCEQQILTVINTDYRADMPDGESRTIKIEKAKLEWINQQLCMANQAALPESIRGLDGTDYAMTIKDEKREQKIEWWCEGGAAYQPFLKAVNELLGMAGISEFDRVEDWGIAEL